MATEKFDPMAFLTAGLGDGVVAATRTCVHIAAEIREDKRLHDRLPAHFVEQRARIMARIDLLVDEHILASHEEVDGA